MGFGGIGIWQLLMVGDTSYPACRDRLLYMARIHNRLTHRPDLTKRLGLLAISVENGNTLDPSYAATPYWRLQHTHRAGLVSFAKQLGIADADPLRCRHQTLALTDPAGKLRALIPASQEPQTVATDLERILDHFEE